MRTRFRSAVMLVLAISALTVCCAPAARAPVTTPDGVTFSLTRMGAKSVSVVGDFNGWSVSAHPMARGGSGNVWKIVVTLPPGEHVFMFVVDGAEWVVPPVAEDYVDDGFGSKNGVVIVRPRER